MKVTVHSIPTSFTTGVLLFPVHYVQQVMEFSKPQTRSAVIIVVIIILVVHYCPLFFHVWLFCVFRLKLFMPDMWFTTDTRSLCDIYEAMGEGLLIFLRYVSRLHRKDFNTAEQTRQETCIHQRQNMLVQILVLI